MPDRPKFIDPFDDCERRPARELFRRFGFEPLPPSAVDEFQLRGRLWEFIYLLAGRRIYLHHTDLLSDRDLYTWLHDEWFEEEIPDMPAEAPRNHHIDMSDFDNGLDPIIWLRYFAAEEERLAFAVEHSLKSIPQHEDPPYDRDRWLPEPPGPPAPSAFDDEDVFPSDEDVDDMTDPNVVHDEDDPLGLAAADAEIRAEHGSDRVRSERDDDDRVRREQLGAATGGESEGWQRPIENLRRSGVTLLPADELTDDTLAPILWELLHNLACRGFYVLHTDHLSDRELYAALWHHGLREEALLPGKTRAGAWFHDFIGSGSEEDIQISLRYYDTEEERADHARDWPSILLPPKEKPPFNRDWRLPLGPF